jgi:thiamine-phosphate pyrophosphorylase
VPAPSAGIAGLYAVTPDEPDTVRLLAGVEAALAGGAAAVQYRHKSADAGLRHTQGSALLALCRRYRRPLIINDHLELALELDADGLHLGADDGDLAGAKARLGPDKILGASCYDRLESALEAQRAGATYVAFGSFFASTVKRGAVRAPLVLLRTARERLSIPVIAIGGITLENAPRLVEAGAHGVAVISALFDAPDVEAAARDFAALFGAIIRPT